MRGRSVPHWMIVGGVALGAALGAMQVMRDMAAPKPALEQVSAAPAAPKVAARKHNKVRQVIAQASQTDKITRALGGSD
ncbi:hypothetical protein H3H37_02275 [Duganella sp. LX20W]|uniref:Uncharacterized protein n=1 Tax=Rugamonas brunnea TaxID=2758569 RepID=A0A7W2ENU6_9BURK|nr:hypothetical protein [Rugamonas brunnea]MBA5635875.1 hypothetical protein [Rugamonas brunnea]